MKTLHHAGLMILVATAAWLTAPTVHAADAIWDNSAADFAWNTTSGNWTIGGPTGLPWANIYGNTNGAVLNGFAAGTITVGPSINVFSLNANTADYTFTGGTLNFSAFGSSTLNVSGLVSIGSGTTTTIDSTIITARGMRLIGGGTLQLGGTGNAFNGWTGLANTGTSMSGLGGNIYVGNTLGSTTFGGTLRVTASSAIPSNTVLAMGHGIFDIGFNNITLAGINYSGLSPSGSTRFTQGVQGSGTITMTGPINAVGNFTGFGNSINTPLDANGGTLRVTVGWASNGANDMVINGAISNGSVLKTFGYSVNGMIGGEGTGGGGLTMNSSSHTYTGSTTINGSTSNLFAGSAPSTALHMVNGTVTLLGAGTQFPSATAVSVTGGGLVLMSNTATISAGFSEPVSAANETNRINTAANLTLSAGAVQMTTAAAAGDFGQTFNNVSVLGGMNRLVLSVGTGSTAFINSTGTLTVGNTGFLILSALNLGDTTTTSATNGRFVFTGTLPTEVNGIIPGIYGTTTVSATATPTEFVRNNTNPGVGLVRLAAADYLINAFSATQVSNITTAQTIATDTSTFAFKTSAAVNVNAGITLTVGAGGILNTGTGGLGGTGTIAFGSVPGRIVSSSSITVAAALTGTEGIVWGSATSALTLTGNLAGLSGTLVNAGGTVNVNTTTFTGSIHVLQGTLATTTGFGTGGTITLGNPDIPAGTIGANANLNINVAAVTTLSRNIATVGSDGSALLGLVATGATITNGANVITMSTTTGQTLSGNISLGTHLILNAAAGAVTHNITGAITGVGGLAYHGTVAASTLTLSNAGNTFSGGLLLASAVSGASGVSTVNAFPTVIGSVAGSLGTGNIRFLGGTVRTDFAGSLNGSGGVTVLTSGTLNTNGNNITIAGPISGQNHAAVFTKSGAGVLTLTANNTFPGVMTVSTGGLTLSGANGAINSLATLNLSSGTALTIDNTSAFNGDRLGDNTQINVSGTGVFINYLSHPSSTNPAEVAGVLNNTGTNTVVSITGSTTPIVIRLANAINTGTITIRGDNLGAASGNFTRVMIDAFTTNQPVLPNVFYASTAGSGTSTLLAGYDTTLGIVLFTPIPTSGTIINNYAPDNVSTVADYTTTGNAVAKTGVTIYSLTLNAGSTLTLDGGNLPTATNAFAPDGTFVISSGILTAQTTNKTVVVGTAASPILAASTLASWTVTATTDLTVNTGITMTGSLGLNKLGAGAFTFQGAYNVTGSSTFSAGTTTFGSSSTFTGAVSLVSQTTGTLDIAATGQTIATVGSATGGTTTVSGSGNTITTLNVTGGTTTISGTSTIVGTLTQTAGTINLNTSLPITSINSTGGTINLGVGTTLTYNPTAATTVNGVFTGPGDISFNPTGVFLTSFNGNSSYTGGMVGNANARVLALSTNAFGTGVLDLSAQTTSSSFGTPTIGFNFGSSGASGTLPNDIILSSTPSIVIFIAQNNASVTGQTLTLSGVISGGVSSQNLVVDESGASHANVVRFTNAGNTLTTIFRTDYGSFGFTSDGSMGNINNSFILNNGTIPANGSLRADASFTMNANRQILLNASGASINTNGNNLTVNGVILGTSPLTKIGAGNLILTGVNTYTGATNVNAGTLTVKNPTPSAGTITLSTTPITVAATHTFAVDVSGSPTDTVNVGSIASSGASLTLSPGTGSAAGANFTMVDGAIGIFNLMQSPSFTGNALTIGGAGTSANAPVLTFDFNGTSIDRINVNGAVAVGASGGKIAINLIGSSFTAGSYTFMTAGSGLGVSGLTLATPSIFYDGNTYAMSMSTSTATAQILTFTQITVANAYWSGAIDSSWYTWNSSLTNWSTAPVTTNSQAIPNLDTNVFFTVTSGAANLGTTLGANFTINSLNFTGSSASVAIGGTHTLTIMAGTANGNTAGNGINMISGTGAVTISAPVALGASQTWTNNSANHLTVTGVVTGAFSLTKAGTGVLTLAGVNTFTGPLHINDGTVNLSGSTAAGTTVNVGTSGTLAGTGTVLGNATLTGSGVINFGTNLGSTGSIAGTLSVTGGNWNGLGSVGGLTTVSSGAFTIGTSGQMTASGGLTVSGTGTLAAAGTSSILSGSLTYSSSSNSTFQGLFLGTGDVTKSGAATLTLSGANLYTGTTTVNAGVLGLPNGIFGSGGTITIADGARVDAAGTIARAFAFTGPSTNGEVRATGSLTLAAASGGRHIGGVLNTQGNFISLSAPAFSNVNHVIMTNGGYLTSGSGIQMPNTTFDPTPGQPGTVRVNGNNATATIGGIFRGGVATGRRRICTRKIRM